MNLYKIQPNVYMTVVNFPAKLFFVKFLYLMFKMFVTLELQAHLCQMHLKCLQVFNTKNVEKLNSGTA